MSIFLEKYCATLPLILILLSFEQVWSYRKEIKFLAPALWLCHLTSFFFFCHFISPKHCKVRFVALASFYGWGHWSLMAVGDLYRECSSVAELGLKSSLLASRVCVFNTCAMYLLADLTCHVTLCNSKTWWECQGSQRFSALDPKFVSILRSFFKQLWLFWLIKIIPTLGLCFFNETFVFWVDTSWHWSLLYE